MFESLTTQVLKINLCLLERYDLYIVAGTCECGNEPLDSAKCGEFLD